MTRFLVLTPFSDTSDLVEAIGSGNLRVLGEWDLTAEDGRPEIWLPHDPAYAYVDTATGHVHALREGRVQIIGGLLTLLGYPDLDAALTPLPRLTDGGDRDPPRVRIDLGLAYDIDTRLMARSAIKGAFPFYPAMTDKDIEELAREKGFTLSRSQIVTILVALLKAIRPEHRPISAREVFTRLDPLPEKGLPSWHPRAGAEARAR